MTNKEQVCPDCDNGSGVIKEFNEFDAYDLFTCPTCKGTGKKLNRIISTGRQGESNFIPTNEQLYKKSDQDAMEMVAVYIQFLFQGETPPAWSKGVKDMRLEQARELLAKLQSLGVIFPKLNEKWVQIKSDETIVKNSRLNIKIY